MGLDMFLYKRIPKVDKEINYKDYQFLNSESLKNLLTDLDLIEGREELIYWRKANAIHKWFVENLADNIDECQEIPVSLSDLMRLYHQIEDLLKVKDIELAKKQLPVSDGFFFGSLEYDESYWEYLSYTLGKLEYVITDNPNVQLLDNSLFFYQASW